MRAVLPAPCRTLAYPLRASFTHTAGPAQRHDPVQCPICSWAAVPPYHKAGASPNKASGKKSPGAAKSPAAAGRKRAAAGGAGAAKRSKQAAAAGSQD